MVVRPSVINDIHIGTEYFIVIRNCIIVSDKPSETDKVINHIAMQQAFNSLDDSERRLIMLRYMQDKTQKQVAEVLGRNQVAISRMEKNTLAKLRRAMM